MDLHSPVVSNSFPFENSFLNVLGSSDSADSIEFQGQIAEAESKEASQVATKKIPTKQLQDLQEAVAQESKSQKEQAIDQSAQRKKGQGIAENRDGLAALLAKIQQQNPKETKGQQADQVKRFNQTEFSQTRMTQGPTAHNQSAQAQSTQALAAQFQTTQSQNLTEDEAKRLTSSTKPDREESLAQIQNQQQTQSSKNLTFLEGNEWTSQSNEASAMSLQTVPEQRLDGKKSKSVTVSAQIQSSLPRTLSDVPSQKNFEGIDEIEFSQQSSDLSLEKSQATLKNHIKAPVKALSSEEFLATLNDLKNQSADSEKRSQSAANVKSDVQVASAGLNLGAKVGSGKIEIDGQVVSEPTQQTRLSHESVSNISLGVRNLSNRGGGEMRIRLRPDHLGELRLVVSAHGNRIGIHIQASNDKAKKIIESSITSLKEGLSSQNLLLSQVDLTVISGTSNSPANDTAQNYQQSDRTNGFQDLLGQNGHSANQNGNQNQSESSVRVDVGHESEIPKGMTAKFGVPQRLAQGRIDVKV